MKTKIIALLVVLISWPVAASEQEVTKTMQQYWSTYARGDFQSVAKLIHPLDLQGYAEHLVPVFLDAAAHRDEDVKSLADVFFSGVAQNKRKSMTPAEVYTGINNIIIAFSPGFFDLLKQSKINITNISFASDNEAEVSYSVIGANEKEITRDVEKLQKQSSTWFIKMKESPKVAAEKFREAFK